MKRNEIAMPGGEDPDNRRDFPGGFPSEESDTQPSAFASATRPADQQSTFAWTAALFAARRSHPTLPGAPQQDLFADETAFVFVRTASISGCTANHAQEAVLVVLITKPVPRSLSIPPGNTALEACNQLQPLAPADNGTASVVNGAVQLEVPADSLFALLGSLKQQD